METDEEEGQDSVKTTPDPNRQDKRKTPEVEEVNTKLQLAPTLSPMVEMGQKGLSR